MAAMQRELIKWIQSMDLSFTCKNPRRDLSNGFTVAEILSKYDTSISLHSFDTGCSIKKKFDNWEQIKKIIWNKNKPKSAITNEDIEGCIQGRGDYGRIILEKLYALYHNGKELKPTVVPAYHEPEAAKPSYMRSTATVTLRVENDETHDRLADITGKKDEAIKTRKNDELLMKHHVTWKAYKMTEPDRFAPIKHASDGKVLGENGEFSGTMTGGTKGSKGSPAPHGGRVKQTVQREMAVRTVDPTVCSVFAQRDEQEKEAAFKAGFDLECDLANSLSRVVYQPMQDFGVLDQLDAAEGREVGSGRGEAGYGSSSEQGGDSQTTTPRKRTGDGVAAGGIDYFAKAFSFRDHIAAEARDAIWDSLHKAATNTAKLIVHRPEEAAHLTLAFAFLWTPTAVGTKQSFEDSETAYYRRHVVEFLSAVGRHGVAIASDKTSHILERYLIPSFASALNIATPSVFADILSCLSSFINPNLIDDVKRLIGCVHQCLQGGAYSARGYSAVYHLLSHLDFGYCYGVDALCQYYASGALCHSHFQARAAGLYMVELLVQSNYQLSLVVLRQVSNLSSDSNWEVRVAQMQVMCSMIHMTTVVSQQQPVPSSEHDVGAGGGEFGGGMTAPAAGGSGDTPRGGGAEYQEALQAQQQAVEMLTPLQSNLLETFASFDVAGVSQQKLTLRTIAPFLGVLNMDISEAFLRRLYSFSDRVRAELLASSGSSSSSGSASPGVETMRGTVRDVYVIGGLCSAWNAAAVAHALVTFRDQYTTYETLSLYDPLVLCSDLHSDRDMWLNVLADLKSELLTAIFDPTNCRGVNDAHELALCGEMATAVTTKYYAELSGEVIEDGGSFNEVQQLAVEWLQSQ